MTLQRYKDHAPTQFDRNVALRGEQAEQNEWFVAPCSLTRDSDSLAWSNWEYQRKALEAVDTVEDLALYGFGHWGPGWYEIALVRPGSECERVARELAARLESYPVLDESDWSEREQEMAWNRVSAMQAIKDGRHELSERTLDILNGVPNDVLMSNIYELTVEIENDYPRVLGDRAQWARFLRAVRKGCGR